jgi:hypothetical protein
MSFMEDGPTAKVPEPSPDGDQDPQSEVPRHKRRKRPNPWKLIRALLLAGRIIWWIFED